MKLYWLFLAFISLFSLSVMSILITILTRKGYPVSFVLLGLGAVLTLFYFSQTFIFFKPALPITFSIFFIMLLIGILSAIGNLTLFQAANNAPNAGLAIAIGAGMQSAVVTILALVFLKDKITPPQIAGIILSI